MKFMMEPSARSCRALNNLIDAKFENTEKAEYKTFFRLVILR